jgi:hypothetical protein
MNFAEQGVVRYETDLAMHGQHIPLNFIQFQLTTIEELTRAWYSRRGWLVYDRRTLPLGDLGSEGGFTVVDMYKNMTILEQSDVQSPAMM